MALLPMAVRSTTPRIWLKMDERFRYNSPKATLVVGLHTIKKQNQSILFFLLGNQTISQHGKMVILSSWENVLRSRQNK